MLNNLTIRKKLALVALGPLLLLLVLASLRIRSDLSETSDATDVQAVATVSARTGQLFDALRVESLENQNLVAITGLDLDAVQADTDAAIDNWLGSVGDFESIDAGTLSNIVSDFNVHRVEIRDIAAESGAMGVYDADSAVLRAVVQFEGLLVQQASPEAVELRDAADLSSVSLAAANLQMLGLASAHSDVLPDELPAAIGASTATAEAYGLRNAVELPVAEGSYGGLLEEFSTLSPGEAVGLSANDWRAASDARAIQLSNLRVAQVAAASTGAVDAQSKAQSDMRTAGLLALIGIVTAIAGVVFIARSFTSALRVLRDEAARVADQDIAELADALSTGRAVAPTAEDRAIETLGNDEFGDVATGLRSIRTNAVDLGGRVARLQAGISDTYVNLARRNQSLVDRQLEAIDTLEAEERDSDRLALMYRVDHLATRMRRNAESLLVLANAKTPERHSPAVELREVLRVAIGEVEDYRRIIPVALDDLHVAGHRAQDLAHLLAELMENAAQHSPPGTAVDVSGTYEAATGDYVVQVLDHGTGIDPTQLAELNQLLATPPESTLTISHSIGLHVVSRLAHSLGLAVSLVSTEDGGTIARVRIPKSVVAQWAHTAPAAGSMPEPIRSTPTAPITQTAPVIPVAEAFEAPAAPTTPYAAPEVVPLAQPQPALEAEAPHPVEQGDSHFSDLVSMPETPSVPVMDMPSLDLPSFGMVPESIEDADPSAAVGAPEVEVFEPEPEPTPGFEVFEPEPEPAPLFEPEPEPTPGFAVFDPGPQPAPVFEEPAPEPEPELGPAPAPVFEQPPQAPAPAPAPVAEETAPSPSVTASGLVKRQRQTSESIPAVDLSADRAAPSQRTPDQVRNMLSRYKTGLERGRGAAGTDGES